MQIAPKQQPTDLVYRVSVPSMQTLSIPRNGWGLYAPGEFLQRDVMNPSVQTLVVAPSPNYDSLVGQSGG